MDMSLLTILLADDHAMLRQGLAALIEAEPDMHVIAEAADGREAIAMARLHLPNVAVIDVSMPGVDGIEATTQIRRQCPMVGVLALTRHADPIYMRRLLRAGASGYVLKRSGADVLIGAVRAIAAGGTYVEPALADGIVAPGFAPAAGTHRPAPRRHELTEREEQVLRHIAWGRSNKEVAAQLGISIKTVEGYKAEALAKLGLRSRSDILRHGLSRGWISDDASPP
jgi:DNA-binding NarL/FixJ family response regulator